jgi:hypothetical protein
MTARHGIVLAVIPPSFADYAVALVGNLLSPQPVEELSPPPPRASWPGEQKLRELGEESKSITEAIRFLAPEVAKARKEYSQKVAAQRGDEYQEIVGSLMPRKFSERQS